MTVAAPSLSFTLVKDQRHLAARAAGDLQAWLSWLELGGASLETRQSYEWTLGKLLRHYPDKGMADFTTDDLMLVLRTYPQRSWRVRSAPMHGWFQWGKRTKRTPENIAEDLPRIRKLKPPDIDVFTDAEVDLLQGLALPNGALMQIMFETGCRRAEALHMRRVDVQMDRGRIVIRDEGAKGGEGRNCLVGAFLLARLDEWFTLDGLEPKDFLWAPRPGGHYYRRQPLPGHSTAMLDTSFIEWWRKALDAAGVRYRKPHTTRHTCATRWLREGGRRETLRKQLGHKSSRTIDAYEHLDETDVRVDLDRVLGGDRGR